MEFTSPDQLRFRKFWLAIGLFMLAFILVIALSPLETPPMPEKAADKILHALAFTVLMVWFSALVPREKWAYLFGLLLAYGCLIEVLQHFTGYRHMSFNDVLADLVGLLVGLGMLKLGFSNWADWFERLVRVR